MPQKPRKGPSKDEPSKKPLRPKPDAPATPKASAPAATRRAGSAKGPVPPTPARPSAKPREGKAAKAGVEAKAKKGSPPPPTPPRATSPKRAPARGRAAAPVGKGASPKAVMAAKKPAPGRAAGESAGADAPPQSVRGHREKAKVEMAESDPRKETHAPTGSAAGGGKPSPRSKTKAPEPATAPAPGAEPVPAPAAKPSSAPAHAAGAPASTPPAPVAPPPAGAPSRPESAAPPAPAAPTRATASEPPRAPAGYAPLPIPSGGDGDEEGWIPIEADDGPQGDDEDTDDRPGNDWRGDDRRPGISPIPDEADEFEPIEEEEAGLPATTPPPGASPHDVLEGVRAGRLHVSTLNMVSDDALSALASEAGLEVRTGERRSDLLVRLLGQRPPVEETRTFETEGLLEILPDGYGFLRKAEQAYAATPEDAYVPGGLLRRHRLETGHWLTTLARAPRSNERYPCVVEVTEVNHEEPAALERIVPFDKLTVTHPDRRLLLETSPEEVSMRLMDLFCPLGRGQRGLIVSPPRAGKTILMTKIADSIARNSPEVEIVVLLLDERPEEVTNMRRSVRGEVIGSTFDQPPHRHIRLAELVMEKVKRMVEFGRHVVLLLDSLTRLGRAYNNESGGTGRLLTGGLEASALTKPKRFFGAARNIEHGGSLTIVATALVDTGSRLDQVIFEEFKGSGNMEVVLSRELANQRLWPAIDIPKSGTRKEELLLHPEEQRRITAIRRAMSGQEAPEALTDILSRMKKHKTNAEFLMNIDLGSLSSGRDVI